EDVHTRWLEEFRRVLTPGGVLIVTTRGRDFIQEIGYLRRNGIPTQPDALLTRHFTALARLYPDINNALAKYDCGFYCFDTCPEYGCIAGLPAYGEACIPKQYVADHWTKSFTLLDYIDDHSQCEQNVIVAQKR